MDADNTKNAGGGEHVTVPPVQNRFLFVDIAALRAKQIRRGALPRLHDVAKVELPHKAERLAMEEVRRGLVQYEVPAPKAKEAL